MRKTAARERSEVGPKRAYSKPALVVYGDLTRITQAIGGGQKGDAAPPIQTKT